MADMRTGVRLQSPQELFGQPLRLLVTHPVRQAVNGIELRVDSGQFVMSI